MATFLKLVSRQTPRLLANARQLNRNIQPCLFISTSKKNKDAISVNETIQTPSKSIEKEESLSEKEENWISFGYDYVDREEDEYQHHLALFVGIGCLVWGGFILAYFPDLRLREWTQREAYLELERREKEGLPLIDPNYVSPEKIDLPTDEELGEFEIVI